MGGRRSARTDHQVVVGGGAAGVTVAARLRRAGAGDIALIEPSDRHYYQPLWSLVGAGLAEATETVRPQARLIPKGVTWLRDRAVDIDPDRRSVTLGGGQVVGYRQLVVAPGLQLDFDRVPGLAQTIGVNGVCSVYRYDLAPRTWQFIRDLRGGTALFTMPAGPVKCAAAGQKIAYLAADWWRRQWLLDRTRIVLVLATPTIFGVPDWARTLEKVVADYGIEVRYDSQLVEVDGPGRRATILDNRSGAREVIGYDLLHAVPPQSAPDWLKDTPLANPASPYGYVDVDRSTLRSPRWPDVFVLGDAADLPTAKSGAAVRRQAPVLVANLLAARAGRPLPRRYDGYSACPIVTAHNRMLLAEFDYELRPRPTFPFLDTTRPRYDMWLLKRYGLPFVYWHGMLRGLV